MDNNTPQADTEIQHSQDMTNTSHQIDSTVTVHGQGVVVCSTRPTNPETSKRGKRRPTMGHGLQDYAKRNGGMKMKIEFSAGRVRPLDPAQAAKLTSQCGIHVRKHMHVATHWKDYSKDGLDHHIPKAIGHVAKHFEMDPKEELSRNVCKNILQKSIRQQRYRLKRDYNNGCTFQEALANKPPNVSQENWEALVNKWSDPRNKELCQKNKDNREAVKHQQTTGSRSYPSHFHQIKKDKYNNEDPSPIEFFKETHTKRKTGSMSPAALNAYTAMLNRKSEAQPEDEQPVSDTQIVAGVLKEHSSSSTFLSTMGYQSRSGRSRTSASTERVRELEERVEQQKRDAIEAHEMYQRQLTERVKAQESALEEMQNKQQQEMEALKKSQEEKMKSYEKKQEETDNLISFLLRKHATQN